MGVGEQGENHVDLNRGDADVKVFAGPSGGSSVHQVFKRSGVHNAMKDFKCPFLRFFRMEAQYPGERLKVPVTKWRDDSRRNWQGRGSEKVDIVEGPSNALKNV